MKNKTSTPNVALVGAGPGDPELLTVKALKRLQKAEVVIYDALVSDEIVREIPESAKRIFIGKPRKSCRITQDEINALLVKYGKKGKRVVRLKGGDPFIFGRGGEEALFLVEHKIAFEIVPAVTAGIGATAYAGIPVTHRKIAKSVAFVTGHEAAGEHETINWQKLAQSVDTLVIYMGLMKMETILENLSKAGKPAITPVAVIESGTTKHQRVVTGLLHNIVQHTQAREIKSPALIVVGDVVNLHKKLNWFTPDVLRPVKNHHRREQKNGILSTVL